MKRIFKNLLFFCFLSLTASTTFAFNINFFDDSPVASFSGDDWKMFNAEADKALNTYPNNKQLNWQNPATGNGGYFKPLSKTMLNGKSCRQMEIFNRDYKARTDKYVFMFCKTNGQWETVTTSN